MKFQCVLTFWSVCFVVVIIHDRKTHTVIETERQRVSEIQTETSLRNTETVRETNRQ